MFSSTTQGIIVLIIVCTFLIILLISFITMILYRYQQKQNVYYTDLEKLKIAHETALLQSKLEIQEQTFQNISREIHDNIGQKLTLAKLHLNTLDLSDSNSVAQKTNDSVELIGEAISDLSDISRSMSSEIVLNNGLVKALELETTQLQKSGLYKVSLSVTGEVIFLDASKELVLFRIVQEALNNIIKHAVASSINIGVHYNTSMLKLDITDNGKGFACEKGSEQGTGLTNMKKRASTLNGDCTIYSNPGEGTTIKIEIPFL